MVTNPYTRPDELVRIDTFIVPECAGVAIVRSTQSIALPVHVASLYIDCEVFPYCFEIFTV
jgi:hypothetical protein